MIGILTEKPSAAQNFAKALGGQKGVYNGEQYLIVAARGHLYEFDDPEKQVTPDKQAKYKSWDLSNLPWNEQDFSWKRVKKKDTSTVLSTIKMALDACDEIVIATDVDATGEGNLIAWEILDELKLHRKKFSRMYFVDETPTSVQKAFVGRKSIQSMWTDMDFVKADFRSKFDFTTMQFTRIATKVGDGVSVLRQGRLKSAMVLLVGDGLKAHHSYKKIPFYENRFRDENGVIYTNPDEPKFPEKNQVPTGYVSSPVIIDSKTMKSLSPPKLPDLAKMSAALSQKGIKAKDVLAVYQKMYEAHVVSYPRTEDKTITPEQFNELARDIDKIAAVVGVDPSLLTHRSFRSTHVKTGGAHGANRPGSNVPNTLEELTKYGSCAIDIYQYLANFALMMFCEDYEYEQQKGHLEKYPKFVGSTNVPKKAGFKAILGSVEDEDDEGMSIGFGKMANPFVHEGFPQRPPHPSMKWLMTQLEKHDVGTGATRTSIYADVTNEKAKFPLMKEVKGKLTLSDYGEMSYHLLPGTHIGDIKMTERLMEQMRGISKGELNPATCLAEVRQMVREDLMTMTNNAMNMRKELGIKMSENNVQKEKFKGVWAETGQEVNFTRTFGEYRFTDEECERLLNGEEIEIHDLISKKTGKPYGIRGKLAEQKYNGRKYVGFLKLGFAGSDGVPQKWCEHVFTDDERKQLEAGETIHIEGCVSRKGNVFACDVRYGKKDDGTTGIIPLFD